MSTNKFLASLFQASLCFTLSVFGSTVWADQGSSLDPSLLCNGNACSEPMINITQAYKEGFADFAQSDLSAYSGKCFHLDSMYNPDYAHLGAFVFAKNSQGMNISGMFGFFYSDDPYTGMSAEEMQSSLLQHGYKGAAGIMRPDHVELAFVSPSSELRYWFRSDKSKKTLFLIGRQADGNHGTSSLVFCKMLRH